MSVDYDILMTKQEIYDTLVFLFSTSDTSVIVKSVFKATVCYIAPT